MKKLSSLSISIILLLLISCFSILGTIIEQDQSLEYYQANYPEQQSSLFFLTWKQIVGWNLSHIYSNIWFILLLLFFFFSLLICTVSKQLPILKRARQWKFLYNKASLNKFTSLKTIYGESFINFIYVLNLQKYYVFHKNNSIYAYKGLLGRIAPIFVHLSIILTLTGAVLGLFGGFFAQEIIPVGEVFHVQNIVKSGYLSKYPGNLIGKINSLNITYNHDDSIQQFFANLSLLDNSGSVLDNKIIFVNRPLKFSGLTFYQTDWQINSLRVRVGSSYICEKLLSKVSNNNTLSSSWFCNIFLGDHHKISIFITNLKNDILIYDINGILIANTKYGFCNVIYGVPIVVEDIMTSTGLQVKTDPGIYITYFGFLILMVSIIISYRSYSQIWANNDLETEEFYFSGFTNRASLIFEEEISLIYKACINLLKVV